MATIAVKGLEEYALMLSKLGSASEAITKEAVYAGAAVVADAIKEALKDLPVEDGFGTDKDPINGITKKQKADLIDGFGLTPIEDKDGYVQTKAGFDGYGSVPTKKYPKGVPNQLIARSVESGTSFRKKNPFIRRTVNKVRGQAQDAMAKEIDSILEKMNGGK